MGLAFLRQALHPSAEGQAQDNVAIKAVFFDLYNTLARFDPPREEQQVRACRDLGLALRPEFLPRAYHQADDFMARENACSPISTRSEEDRRRFFTDYEGIILRGCGLAVSDDLAYQVFARVRQNPTRLALFDDALPTLSALKRRGFVLGLLSNIHRDLKRITDDLGLASYLDFALSSQEAGAEKPYPPLFLAALARAGVKPQEALHVGDQYRNDVVGALGGGNPAVAA